LIVWVDAQLSPALAPWLERELGVRAFSIRYLRLLRSKDREIFSAAREANVVVWLPARVREVELAGDLLMRRGRR
jgi:predicted nuclease of predicted toxin-antitoxin system